MPDELDEDAAPQRVGVIKKVFDKTWWFWLLIIAYGLLVQCVRTASMGRSQRTFVGE